MFAWETCFPHPNGRATASDPKRTWSSEELAELVKVEDVYSTRFHVAENNVARSILVRSELFFIFVAFFADKNA